LRAIEKKEKRERMDSPLWDVIKRVEEICEALVLGAQRSTPIGIDEDRRIDRLFELVLRE